MKWKKRTWFAPQTLKKQFLHQPLLQLSSTLLKLLESRSFLPLYSTWSPRPLKESIWCGKKPFTKWMVLALAICRLFQTHFGFIEYRCTQKLVLKIWQLWFGSFCILFLKVHSNYFISKSHFKSLKLINRTKRWIFQFEPHLTLEKNSSQSLETHQHTRIGNP